MGMERFEPVGTFWMALSGIVFLVVFVGDKADGGHGGSGIFG